MKNFKMRTIITAAVLAVNTVCIYLLYLIARDSITAAMKQSEMENLYASLNAETKIIREYVSHQEDLLITYSHASEVIEFLREPDNEEKRIAAQKYTEDYYSRLDNWEGLYIGEWNTHVIAHSNPAVIGMITREEGEYRKALQDAMSDGLYNAGIIVSPASSRLILSLYCPVYDYDGSTILGYVGGGPFADSLEELLASVESETATYYMINALSGMYIFAQDDTLMAKNIEDEMLLSIIGELSENPQLRNGDKEYADETEGKAIAVYQNMPEYGWALVSCNSEKNIYADVDAIISILGIICIASNIVIGALSWIIIRISTKPLRYAAESIVQLQEMKLEKNHKLDKYINTKGDIGQIATAIDSLYDSIGDMLDAEKEKQVAIAANEAKARFLASMSHEIRTPINAIIGMNDMILRENTNEEIEEYAYNIKSASRMLLGIVSDILDFSKIEAGKLSLVESDYLLQPMLNDGLLSVAAYSKEKSLKLITDIDEALPTALRGDEIRIKQIMNNLLSNAVKYTEKGNVTLTVNGVKDEKGFSLVISVSDTGIGIKPEDISSLFERFQRLDTEKNHHIEGTGLGLSITKQLVENMNGEITVQSRYGVGSCFTVRIPQTVVDSTPMGKFDRSYKRSGQAANPTLNSFRAPGAKVLAVDDNGMNLRVIKLLLKHSEMHIDFATSGKKCIEMTEKTKYDLILMDHMMPEMDGIETLKQIRSDKKNLSNATPAVILTANVASGIKDYYKDAGFEGFLSKPIMDNQLTDIISAFIRVEDFSDTDNHS